MTLAEATILVVDDEPILRMTFSLLLRQQGASVHLAAHGQEGLLLLKDERIDMMLTDRQMPVMDGMTLLRTMHAQGLQVPSILFVNGVEPEDIDELQRLQVMETVRKPLHPEQLIAAVSRVLSSIPSRST